MREPDPDAVATPPLLVAFDLLYQDGRELTGRPLRERRVRLEKVVAGGDLVLRVRRLAKDGFEAWSEVIAHDYEGMVAKEETSLYEPGPTRRQRAPHNEASALPPVALKFPGCEASRVNMVAVPSEFLASELKFDLHLLALHQIATHWASCSAPAVLRQVAIRRACGEQTIPDCFTGLFSETQLIRHPDNGPRFRHALHRLA